MCIRDRFKRIDADLSDSFKEETSKDELKDMTEKLSKTFKDALGNENLTVSVEKLKDASISVSYTHLPIIPGTKCPLSVYS